MVFHRPLSFMKLFPLVGLFTLLSLSLSAAENVALTAVAEMREADYEQARPVVDKNALKEPLRIAGREFTHGIGTQVDNRIAVALGGAERFTAMVGVDDATAGGEFLVFEVIADDQSLWRRELKKGASPVALDIDLRGRKTLVLATRDIGNAYSKGYGDWIDPQLRVEGEKPKSIAPPVSRVEEMVILTPKSALTPRINGPRVFGVRPDRPFLFQIPATGERPMKFSASGLPAGLTIDSSTGCITGHTTQASTYTVTLNATNTRGTDTKTLRIEVGERIALTPPMGWNSWNCWGAAVDQDKVLASAKVMVASGLIEHGWTYVNIDDAWQGTRTGPGHAMLSNERFPDMKRLCDEVHALGLRVGLYSTPWITSFASYVGGSADTEDGAWIKPANQRPDRRIGRFSFASVDAKQWAAWGMDYLKYDWNTNEAPETKDMSDALRASGRDIVFSLSNTAPFQNAAVLSQLAQCWRTTGDIFDNWGSISRLGFGQEKWRAFAGPGHWNDPDMLVVGLVDIGRGEQLAPTRLTPNEQYTHISLWSMLSAPLLIGCPIERADAFTLNLLTNDEVLALNQDELGKQAQQFLIDGRKQVFVKNLVDGSCAVGLFNLAQEAQTVFVSWKQLGITSPTRVRDLWRQQDIKANAEGLSAEVPRHGVFLVRVWTK